MKSILIILFLILFLLPILANTPTAKDTFREGLRIAGPKYDNDLAIDYFNYAIDLDPFNSYYYLSRAGYMWERNHKNALSDYDNAIGLDPDDSSKYIWRGKLKLDMGLVESGCDDLRIAATLNYQYIDQWIEDYCGN